MVAATRTTPFTVRLEETDHRTLEMLAKVRGTTVAELARDFILDAIPQQLDPDEIERQVESERQRLLKAAAEIRKQRAERIAAN